MASAKFARTALSPADGREREVDAIIFGTGFKAQDPIPRGTFFFFFFFFFRSQTGRTSSTHTRMGSKPISARRCTVFPNFFILMGPNTGLGHNSMVYMIESQVHTLFNACERCALISCARSMVRADVQKRFNDWVQKDLSHTVWSSGCRSWYLTDKGKNTVLWPGFTFTFRRMTRQFRKSDYVLEVEKGTVRT